MPNRISSNPNASVTAFAGAVTIMLIWIAGVVGLNVPGEVGSAFTTVSAAAILWIGRTTKATPVAEAATA